MLSFTRQGETAIAVLWRSRVSFRRNIEKVWQNDILSYTLRKERGNEAQIDAGPLY